MFASFTYQSAQFDTDMHDYIKERLGVWMGLFAEIFDRLSESYESKSLEITGSSLTEMMAAIFEGGLLLTRALDDKDYLRRQLQQFRVMLPLLFVNQIQN